MLHNYVFGVRDMRMNEIVVLSAVKGKKNVIVLACGDLDYFHMGASLGSTSLRESSNANQLYLK